MLTSRFRLVAVVFNVSVLLVFAGAVAWPSVPRVHAAGADESKLKALLKEKLLIVQEAAAQATKAYQSGEAPFTKVLEAKREVGKAQLELCDTDEQRLAVLEKMLAEARDYEKSVAEHIKSGVSPGSGIVQAKLNRLEIEIALERIKGK